MLPLWAQVLIGRLRAAQDPSGDLHLIHRESIPNLDGYALELLLFFGSRFILLYQLELPNFDMGRPCELHLIKLDVLPRAVERGRVVIFSCRTLLTSCIFWTLSCWLYG